MVTWIDGWSCRSGWTPTATLVRSRQQHRRGTVLEACLRGAHDLVDSGPVSLIRGVTRLWQSHTLSRGVGRVTRVGERGSHAALSDGPGPARSERARPTHITCGVIVEADKVVGASVHGDAHCAAAHQEAVIATRHTTATVTTDLLLLVLLLLLALLRIAALLHLLIPLGKQVLFRG